jgi:hypothetical protein
LSKIILTAIKKSKAKQHLILADCPEIVFSDEPQVVIN